MGEITFMMCTRCSFGFFIADSKSICGLLLKGSLYFVPDEKRQTEIRQNGC
jgi:hypothetical protein